MPQNSAQKKILNISIQVSLMPFPTLFVYCRFTSSLPSHCFQMNTVDERKKGGGGDEKFLIYIKSLIAFSMPVPSFF